MSAAIATSQSTVLAFYPDHSTAEQAVLLLQKAGLPMQQLSIIGRDFRTVEKPIGFVTTGSVACQGAKFGAWTGGIFGLLVGAAFLIIPGVGPLIIMGPFAATIIGGVEGALAGSAFGGLAGSLVGLGLSSSQAIRYESEIKTGKFLLTLNGDMDQVQKAKTILNANGGKNVEIVESEIS